MTCMYLCTYLGKDFLWTWELYIMRVCEGECIQVCMHVLAYSRYVKACAHVSVYVCSFGAYLYEEIVEIDMSADRNI
jgi:hypothetical protein